jgi:hypothetical protein
MTPLHLLRNHIMLAENAIVPRTPPVITETSACQKMHFRRDTVKMPTPVPPSIKNKAQCFHSEIVTTPVVSTGVQRN